MKVRKRLGNVLTCLGGITLFIGILAYILPRIENRQMKLVIQSFRTPTDHWLLQLMNNGMTGAMENWLPVIIIGAAVLLLGILLICSVRSEPAPQPAPKVRAVPAPAPVAVPVTANPFAHTQPVREEEGNPFARYIAADAVPKSTHAPEVAQPEVQEEPAPQTEAAAEMFFARPTQPEEPAVQQPEVFYGLIDEDELPDDDDDDDDDEDEDIFDPCEEAPRMIAQPVYDPAQAYFLPEIDPEPAEERMEETVEEAVEEPVEASVAEAGEAVSPEPTEEADAPLQNDPQPEPEPETLREKAEEAKQNARQQAATGGLRPAIRSTFRKTTPAAQQAAAGESADAQPVSRIRSTMGHKR